MKMIRHRGKKKKKKSECFNVFVVLRLKTHSVNRDKGISVCSSQREAWQLSSPARRKRGLRGASGCRRDRSGSSRAPLWKSRS